MTNDSPVTSSVSSAPMTFQEIYTEHFRFVWRALRGLGISENDIHDAVQDVFLAVHRKLESFEGRSQLKSWLFGICMHVASNRRRRAHQRREISTEPETLDVPDSRGDLLALTEQRLRLQKLEAILEQLPEEQRAVFVLFELEGMRCEDIANLMQIPLGTAYSRLRLARQNFRQAVARLAARDRFDKLEHRGNP